MKTWINLQNHLKETYGYEPESLIMEYIGEVDKGKVLDLGVGTGRNSLFLSTAGFQVEGVDIEESNVENYLKKAKELNLDIAATVADIRDFEVKEDEYSLIIISWVLNFFNKKDIESILSKIKKGLKPNGMVYFSVFSIEDDFYIKNLDKLTEEEHTLCFGDNEHYRHYYTKEEVVEYFKDLELLALRNGMVLDIDKVNGNHYHDMIEYIGKRK